MVGVNVLLKLFIEYLQMERNYSKNTIEQYQHDISEFSLFRTEQAITEVKKVQYLDARLYLTKLYDKKLLKKIISEKIFALRGFYKFLVQEKYAADNPFALVIHK